MSDSKPQTTGGSVRTHPLPPKGFDPRTASARELRRYGLPQRPDPAIHPQLAARWEEFSRARLLISLPPSGRWRSCCPALSVKAARGGLGDGPEFHLVGGRVHATGSQTFTWVLGQWNVPDVAPAAGGKGSQYTFAFIGIDGNTDVTQIGTIQSVSTAANGSVSKSCYAVYEWFPISWSAITNLPVSFGDTMLGLICLTPQPRRSSAC